MARTHLTFRWNFLFFTCLRLIRVNTHSLYILYIYLIFPMMEEKPYETTQHIQFLIQNKNRVRARKINYKTRARDVRREQKSAYDTSKPYENTKIIDTYMCIDAYNIYAHSVNAMRLYENLLSVKIALASFSSNPSHSVSFRFVSKKKNPKFSLSRRMFSLFDWVLCVRFLFISILPATSVCAFSFCIVAIWYGWCCCMWIVGMMLRNGTATTSTITPFIPKLSCAYTVSSAKPNIRASERASGHTHRFIMCTSTHLNKPIEPTNQPASQPTLSIHIASNPYTHTSIQIDRWMYEHVCYGIWSSARFFLFSVRCEILSLHTAQ